VSSLSKSIKIDSLDTDAQADDLELRRGSFLQLDYTVYASDGSTAIDLTGATVRFTALDIEGDANEFQLVMQPITTATWSGDVVTFTATAHGYVATDTVAVEDCGNTDYNGNYTVVSAPTVDTFTAALTPDPGAFTTDGYVSQYPGKITMTTEASGTFSVYLTDTQTDTDAKTYLYDIHIVLTGGTEHHAAWGKLRIYPTPYTGP
jgi:hypothetical protein